jgi:RNA polymerase sigma-70 factor (ECF subfamily)
MPGVQDEVEAHLKSLRRYACALVGNTSDADDLVQEAVKRAIYYCADGREIKDVRAYLFTILHNVRTDQAVKAQRGGPQVPIDDDGPQLPCAATQESTVECRQLGAALRQLPESQRQVVLLVGMEGMAYREAAEALGLPIGTIMSRLNRGRQRLRELMASDRRPGSGRS